MRLLLALCDQAHGSALRDTLESRDEHTSCDICSCGMEALNKYRTCAYDAIVLDTALRSLDGYQLLKLMHAKPTWHCPYVLFLGQSDLCDQCIVRDASDQALINALDDAMAAPESLLYRVTREKREQCAGELLDRISMPPTLKGRQYLKMLIPLALGHAKHRERLKYTLYPYAAKAFQVSGASVERCIRHAIENTFSHSALGAIEAFFGQSYDPERGKPTNREFIAMAQIHLEEDFDL